MAERDADEAEAKRVRDEIGLRLKEAHYPGRAPIEAYGNGGFRFADMSHQGAILCLPSGIYGWRPRDLGTLDVSDFDRIASEAGLEFLLLGTGTELQPVPSAIREALAASNVRVEPMSTGAAVRTLNVLLAEDRPVGAGLLPVD